MGYKILVLNGPNLNFLGIREPQIYGHETYDDLLLMIKKHAAECNVEVSFFQSNHEGALIDAIQKAYFDKIDGIVFNPGAYTHTSIALADAVKSVSIPTVEVHISDVSTRESFRQVSYIREHTVSQVVGEGLKGYNTAIDRLTEYLGKNR